MPMRSPGNDGLTFGATVKADKEAGKFPIKDKDSALAAAFAFLRENVLQRLSFSDCSSYAFPPFAKPPLFPIYVPSATCIPSDSRRFVYLSTGRLP